MNPNNTQPSFELPPPQAPQGGESNSSVENTVARPEMYSQPQPVAPQQQSHTSPQQQQLQQSAALPLSTPLGSNPQIADDVDLIEKEWVSKAKQIIAATREDPNLQNKEISRFKADYLKKRYNKDIKLEES